MFPSGTWWRVSLCPWMGHFFCRDHMMRQFDSGTSRANRASAASPTKVSHTYSIKSSEPFLPKKTKQPKRWHQTPQLPSTSQLKAENYFIINIFWLQHNESADAPSIIITIITTMLFLVFQTSTKSEQCIQNISHPAKNFLSPKWVWYLNVLTLMCAVKIIQNLIAVNQMRFVSVSSTSVVEIILGFAAGFLMKCLSCRPPSPRRSFTFIHYKWSGWSWQEHEKETGHHDHDWHFVINQSLSLLKASSLQTACQESIIPPLSGPKDWSSPSSVTFSNLLQPLTLLPQNVALFSVTTAISLSRFSCITSCQKNNSKRL